MSSQIQVRYPTSAEIPRLAVMDHSLSSEAVWQLEFRRDSAEQVTAAFREVRLPRPTSVVFPYQPQALVDEWTKKAFMQIAVIADRPVGYVCVQERAPASFACVTELVVDAAQRRNGVASALLLVAQTWAGERQHRRLVLEMQSKNQPMIRLAQKFGYEFCGYNDHYFPTQDVALFFGRALK